MEDRQTNLLLASARALSKEKIREIRTLIAIRPVVPHPRSWLTRNIKREALLQIAINVESSVLRGPVNAVFMYLSGTIRRGRTCRSSGGPALRVDSLVCVPDWICLTWPNYRERARIGQVLDIDFLTVGLVEKETCLLNIPNLMQEVHIEVIP